MCQSRRDPSATAEAEQILVEAAQVGLLAHLADSVLISPKRRESARASLMREAARACTLATRARTRTIVDAIPDLVRTGSEADLAKWRNGTGGRTESNEQKALVVVFLWMTEVQDGQTHIIIK